MSGGSQAGSGSVAKARMWAALRRAPSPVALSLGLALACGCVPIAATAQDTSTPTSEPEGEPLSPQEIEQFGRETGQVAPDDYPLVPEERRFDRIDFEADQLQYDNETEIVTARGNVILRSEDNSVRADQVVWDRNSGQITASGNIRFVDDSGNQLYTESLNLTDKFEAAAMSELLLALRAGGRLAARSGERENDGTVILTDAAYTACAVTGEDGCAKNPSWRITADRVTYSPENNRVRFRGAMLELFGARILPLPGLSLRTDGQAESGFLVPDVRITAVNGLELSGQYYMRLAPNKDVTLGARVYSSVAPMATAEWRHLTGTGAYQINGFATVSSRTTDFTGLPATQSDPRGYLAANGRFQLSPEWSITGSLRVASDRTFLRRYDISRDDRLRSTLNIERIDDQSYLSIAGWATQTLRITADQGQIPIALPAVDYRRIIKEPVLGGDIELQANTLALLRTDGQDTQRAFAGAKWDLRRLTDLGQVITATALVRGDVYHTSDTLSTLTDAYRGNEGWTARGIAVGAVDVEWPFAGEAFGGTQVITPRIQIVASPKIENLAVPNEDARAIDLEDSNLFSLNRFPGYDRVEDGTRITWGVDWELRRPGWRVHTNIGQSYRLDAPRDVFPDGTGLSERVSDLVGRTEVAYQDFVKFTHRFRLDKDNLAIRRNEIDATVGSRKTYLELGYLRLNRDITTVEDLQDREEFRAAARVAFANHWSVFGSGVFNLTNADEDPTFNPDGFEPIRTRLGVAYQDDCIEFGVTWRRDYITAGDAERGNTFQLFFALRNLGFQ